MYFLFLEYFKIYLLLNKGGEFMNLTSTPIAARVRLTYDNDLTDLSFTGINPAANAFHLKAFCDSVASIQDTLYHDVFLTVENELVMA